MTWNGWALLQISEYLPKKRGNESNRTMHLVAGFNLPHYCSRDNEDRRKKCLQIKYHSFVRSSRLSWNHICRSRITWFDPGYFRETWGPISAWIGNLNECFIAFVDSPLHESDLHKWFHKFPSARMACLQDFFNRYRSHILTYNLLATFSSLPCSPGCCVIIGRVTAKNASPPLLLLNWHLVPTWKNAKSPATKWCVTPVASSKMSIWPERTYLVSS